MSEQEGGRSPGGCLAQQLPTTARGEPRPGHALSYTWDSKSGLAGGARMRLAVLSDIHGNLPALEAVVDDVTHRGVDGVVNLGDSLSGPLMASATADFLMAQPWSQIAGNHDRNLATSNPAGLGPSDACAYAELGHEALAWVAQLPPSVILHGRVLLIHGTPARDTEYLLETVVRGVPRLAAPTEIALDPRRCEDGGRSVRPLAHPEERPNPIRPAHRQSRQRRPAGL